MIDRTLSIAPMMECTDRHERYFLRLISPHALLYTEMVTTGALMHGDWKHFLAFHPAEHPIALQLGGNEPVALAHCATLGENQGYDEINLNVGCPSPRVKSGCFGASLMLEPARVADCINAMCAVVNIPVTVKCRIGVDDQDSYEHLFQFIQMVAAAGCDVFIIHARKAWLHGLSPKQNREVPPLRYDVVKKIKQDFPHLTIVLNGGIKTIKDMQAALQWADGVMIGREAYSNPYFLTEIEKKYFASLKDIQTRYEIIMQLIPYLEDQLKNRVKLSSMTRHILGLYHGQPNARIWRRYLSENACNNDAGIEVLYSALEKITQKRGEKYA